MFKFVRFIPTVILSVLFTATIVYAGSLTPPGSVSDTMYTLTDLYNLSAGTSGTEGSGSIPSTPGSASATFHTLTEIYEAIFDQIDNLSNGTIANGVSSFGFTGTLLGDTTASRVLTTATYPGTYDASNLSTSTVKSGTAFGVSQTGALTPDGGTATVADLFNGKTAHLTSDWSLDTGTLDLACNTSTFNGTANLVATAYDGSGDGTNRWCMKETGDAVAGDIISGKTAWVDGTEVSGSITVKTGDNTASAVATSSNTILLTVPAGYYGGSATVSTSSSAFTAANIKLGTNIFGIVGTLASGYTYGDSDASKVLTTATGAGTYNATNLSTDNVRVGTSFGVSSTGTLYPGGLPRTGQTGCFDASGGSISCSGTGQDGDAAKGITRSFTDNGDGTITDNITGLVWQKCHKGLSGASCGTGTATGDTWANALTYCNANTAGLPGSGWRLPNKFALDSLYNYGVSTPFVYSTYFPGSHATAFWSSTSRPGGETSAITTNFTTAGNPEFASKGSSLFIRCVRGG